MQLLLILSGNQLMQHASEKVPAPPTTVNSAPNPAYTEWYIKDQLVLSWIISSLSESAM